MLLSNKKNNEIRNLTIKFEPPYPLNIIFDEECMFLYNLIFRFLLHIKKARFALTDKNYVLKKTCKMLDIYFNELTEFEIEVKKIALRKIEMMKRKMCFAQKELFNFLESLEFFIFEVVIRTSKNSFLDYLTN